jgi:hypothetical protein
MIGSKAIGTAGQFPAIAPTSSPRLPSPRWEGLGVGYACSLFPIPCSPFPVPCSLLPPNAKLPRLLQDTGSSPRRVD